MTTILGILAVLGFISALGAAWDLLGKLAPSDADRTRAQGTVDYYAKVWDSTSQ
jgi:hypothetical protein